MKLSKMGLLSRVSRAPPPTATDFAQVDNVLSQRDPEIAGANCEEHIESATHVHQRHMVPQIERRLVRKMDLRIVPLVTACYVLAFLGRLNIGNARITVMTHDLKLVDNDYQWLLMIFYITYILFEWQSLMWKIMPPHI